MCYERTGHVLDVPSWGHSAPARRTLETVSRSWFAVIELKTRRPKPLWFSLVFVLLAISVFSWGLGYKLSLYHGSSSRLHSLPSAKLVTGDEQNTSDHAILSFDSSGLPLIEGGGLTLLLMLPFVGNRIGKITVRQWELDTAGASVGRRQASLSSFFFRPPPPLHV
jgi:hypothetical protein